MVLEFPGVSDSDGARFKDALDNSVVIESGRKIPCFDGMIVPTRIARRRPIIIIGWLAMMIEPELSAAIMASPTVSRTLLSSNSE